MIYIQRTHGLKNKTKETLHNFSLRNGRIEPIYCHSVLEADCAESIFTEK